MASKPNAERALVKAIQMAWTLLSFRDVEEIIDPASYKKAKHQARVATEMTGQMIYKSDPLFCPKCKGQVKPSNHKSLPAGLKDRRAFACLTCNVAYFSDQVTL